MIVSEDTLKSTPANGTAKPPTLIRVVSRYFVAGFETNGTVQRAAPIIGYMVGWTDDRARKYIERKGWQAMVIE